MKQKEWLIVGGVALVSAIFSIVISGAIFGSPKKNPIKVPVVTPISSNFPSPETDDSYKSFFNKQAIDPTTLIQIGNTQNNQPFQNGGNH
jgi:hypothetical protein